MHQLALCDGTHTAVVGGVSTWKVMMLAVVAGAGGGGSGGGGSACIWWR